MVETKRCRQCGDVKTLPFFPLDRSRPAGRWHTCRACNRLHWTTRGKRIAAEVKAQAQADHRKLTGLAGLRHYRHHKAQELFTSLSPAYRPVARQLLNKYLTRHSGHMTRHRYAALIACAASNAPRVGDRSWARRMWRLKGYRRAERRQAEEATRLAEIRVKNAGQPRIWSGNLEGI
jgi:hypothetical protein